MESVTICLVYTYTLYGIGLGRILQRPPPPRGPQTNPSCIPHLLELGHYVYQREIERKEREALLPYTSSTILQ